MANLIKIKIADICIGIEPLNEGFDSFCEDYMVDEEPDFLLRATERDLKEERKRVAEYEDQLEGIDYSMFELEKIWVYRQIAETIPKYDAFLIHATSVRVDEDAYLFLGPSGAGKTTHAKLWEQHFTDRFTIINDDKPIIRITDENIMVCSSPWCGKERWNRNIAAPLRGLIRVKQSERIEIEVMDSEEAWETMMNQVYRSADHETMQKILTLISAVIGSTSIYELECRMNREAVTVAFERINRRG